MKIVKYSKVINFVRTLAIIVAASLIGTSVHAEPTDALMRLLYASEFTAVDQAASSSNSALSELFSPDAETDNFGNSMKTFYRGMKTTDYDYLRSNSEVKPSTETCVSPNQAYAAKYATQADETLAEIRVKYSLLPLLLIQGRSANSGTRNLGAPLTDLVDVNSGWKNELQVMFKKETDSNNNNNVVVNICLGTKGVELFEVESVNSVTVN